MALFATLACVVSLWVVQPSGQAVAAPAVFTQAQADAGRATYKSACASCHTSDLGGNAEFPQLAGDDFMSAWRARTTKDLYDFIHDTMPPEGPMLSPEQALGLVAFILHQNGATPGTTALTATTDASIGTVATGKRPGLVEAPHKGVPYIAQLLDRRANPSKHLSIRRAPLAGVPSAAPALGWLYGVPGANR